MPIAIFALFLGTLSIGTTEFMISGILPQIAADLRVTIPEAGLLVTAYAIGVAVGGPVMAVSLARLPRKTAAIALMGLFVVGHVIVGLSTNYLWAMFGRIVCAVGHGGYFGVAVVLAANIAPKERVGAALSFIFAGVTIANIVGVPLGAVLGDFFGWRTPIWAVAAMATIGLAAVIVLVPKTDAGSSANGAFLAQIKVLGRQQVLTAFGLIFLMMVAIWGFSTFFAPYTTDIAGMPPSWIPLLLFLSGTFSTVGILIGGRLADRYPNLTMRIAFPMIAVLYIALYLVGPVNLWGAIAVIGVLYLPITAVWTTTSNRALLAAQEAPDLTSTLLSSAANVGSATGSWIAATALTAGVNYNQLPLISAGAGVATIILAYIGLALDKLRPSANAEVGL